MLIGKSDRFVLDLAWEQCREFQRGGCRSYTFVRASDVSRFLCGFWGGQNGLSWGRWACQVFFHGNCMLNEAGVWSEWWACYLKTPYHDREHQIMASISVFVSKTFPSQTSIIVLFLRGQSSSKSNSRPISQPPAWPKSPVELQESPLTPFEYFSGQSLG